MKKILVLLSCISFSFIMSAQEKNALVVQLCNDSMEKYILSEKPMVSFSGENMLVTVDNKVELDIKRSEIERFYFDYIDPDNVQAMTKNMVSFYHLDGNNIRIIGLQNNTMVSILTIDGKKVSTYHSDESGILSISLNNQPKGIYIIQFNGRSIKVRVN